jgi:imidazolonepropionase-like amidohydrolase
MCRSLVRTLLLLALLTCAAWASDLALVGAKIYPSPTDPPIEKGSILLGEGRILAVGSASTIKIPKDAIVINCEGLVVTAGFWNSHVHILTPRLLQARNAPRSELNDELDLMFNRWGFTTVFDISSVLDNTLALRGRIDSGELRGPRIFTVGEPIWTIAPVYVRDFLNQHHILIPATRTPDEAIALVRSHSAKGANGIKLFTGSYQGAGKVAVLPPAVAKAAVEEAHRHLMPVFAHPQNIDGVDVAINSGVDVLAHTVPQSPPWTREFVSRLNNAHLALIPTLTLFDFESRKGDASQQERDQWLSKMVAELAAYNQAGGDVLFGTDIGYIDHYDTAMEFALMSKAGMTFPQILASLTANPVRKFGYSDHLGRIARGMDADLVVLNADPALDISALSKVRYTIRAGKIVYKEK